MASPKVGQIFQGRYQLLSELGVGGMGSVFRAHQIDANRDVAIKLLRPAMIEDEDTIKRFRREFKILSGLEHVHIMSIYGLALDDENVPYAICEFIDGKSLRQVLSVSGALDWRRATNIVLQICDGMNYIHNHDILHRDLKPDNLMLLDKPEPDYVKLIDFGLSKASIVQLDESQKLTHTGELLGSPHYMCPEQLSGATDRRSDIYALGCVFFEMLSGEKLFDADSAVAIMYMHANQAFEERLTAIRTPIPRRLRDILSRLLEKKPEKRYQQMQEIYDALTGLLEQPGDLSDCSKSALKSHGRNSFLLLLVFLIPLLLIFVVLCSSHHSLKTENQTIGTSIKQNAIRQQITELKARVRRSSGSFERASGGLQKENGEALLHQLQALALMEISSSSARDHVDALETSVMEIDIANKQGNYDQVAAAYALKAQTEVLLKDYDDANKDVGLSEATMLAHHNAEASSAFHDLLLYKCWVLINQTKMKEARQTLESVDRFWNLHHLVSPIHWEQRDQLLVPGGPDRFQLVLMCRRSLENCQLHNEDEIAQALDLSNLFTTIFYRFKHEVGAKESVILSKRLAARLSPQYSGLIEKSKALAKEIDEGDKSILHQRLY